MTEQPLTVEETKRLLDFYAHIDTDSLLARALRQLQAQAAELGRLRAVVGRAARCRCAWVDEGGSDYDCAEAKRDDPCVFCEARAAGIEGGRTCP
jgi:hypothetical protein